MNKENKTQGNSIIERSDNFERLNARRKLIKGSAFVVPAVMTLRSGALMAAASTETCIARDQKFADTQNPKKFINSNSDSFVRTKTTIAKVIRVKQDAVTLKWVYDKKTNGNLRNKTLYVHGHGLATPLPTQWVHSSAGAQTLFTRLNDIIDVFDVAADPLPDIAGADSFSDGTHTYVLNTNFSTDGLDKKYGLVTTSRTGAIQMDLLDGPQVDRFVGHADLTDNTNHITGSCWSSLGPMTP